MLLIEAPFIIQIADFSIFFYSHRGVFIQKINDISAFSLEITAIPGKYF